MDRKTVNASSMPPNCPFGSFLRQFVWTTVMLSASLPGLAIASTNATLRFEAESGVLGSDFAVSNSAAPAYITINTDYAGNYPSNAARVATYVVTFPTAGTYQLYAHVRVGPGGFNDDSMFYGNGFGVKDPALNSDWILVNGLASAGFTNATETVTDGGTLGSGVWKWINLSLFAPGPTFTVSGGSLTQTFQIGARENGLDLDAFVFGLSSFTYTVSNLDTGVDNTPPAAGVCSIHWTNVLQRIDGFGGGVVYLDAGLDPVTSANMNTLFGTNNSTQLGLTLLRVRIDPTTNWVTALSDAQKAVARGAGVLATPWTPPASMKDNGVLTNGSLLPSQYANYASYLKTFADYMSANGAPLRAISVQNEPDWPATYESCVWSGTQFLNFFRTNAAAIGSTPVMMPESLGYNFSYSDPTLNDPVAATNVALVGGHLYGVTTIQDYANAHSKGKPTWMTEYLLNDQTIGSAIATAQQIHDCLTTGNMSAYIWWKTLGNANGLVNASGVPQIRGFVMAQFSRFVRPNYYRLGVSNNANTSITAYKATNSPNFAIVAINSNATMAVTQTFGLTDFNATTVTPWITTAAQSLAVQTPLGLTNSAFTYTLPAMSIVTFVGQSASSPNTAPTLVPVVSRTINAGVTLVFTNVATDPEVPPQTLAFSLLTGPTNATLNAANGVFLWRPLVSQAGTTNPVSVQVADTGSPSLSATNNFTVTVNPLSAPSLNLQAGSAGQVTLLVNGAQGPDYALLTTTNLDAGWRMLYTTNSPAMPLTLMDTNSSDRARFYRVQLGP